MAQFKASKKFTGVLFSTLKDGDKSYYITYKINGKVTRIHIGKQSEGVTEQFCHQKRNDAINNAKFGDDASIIKTKKKSKPFIELADEYFKYSEIHNKDHYNQLKRYDKHLKPYCDHVSIDEVTISFMETIQKDKKKILAPKSVNHITQMIGTIINHAISRDLIKIKNPITKLKKLPVNNQRQRYLNLDEINLLLDGVRGDHQLFLFTKLALNTGARLFSIINIRKKDIDFQNNLVTITDYKNDTTYTGFLKKDIMDILIDKCANIKNNDFILLNGTQMSNLDYLNFRTYKSSI